MSLTEAEHVFAGVHENGINDFLKAFLTARPRYINYGSPSFVPVTTALATNVPAIAFPGIPGGIQYAVRFSIPSLDCHPDSSGGASPLPPGPGQFSIRTKVTITVACGRWEQHPNTDKPPSGAFIPLSTSLDVWVRGKPTVAYFGPGVGEIGFMVEDIEIVDIKPDSLESVLECIIRMILQAVLANVRLPFHALTIGAFSLILLRGPEIEDDQIKLYGDV
ncbi:MAG: hypothetical protein HYU86_09940 [Chloroflexi bacterium]|nr:hypothetical protein [Chloroflexota bacterium]